MLNCLVSPPNFNSSGFFCSFSTIAGDRYVPNCFLICCFCRYSLTNLIPYACNNTSIPPPSTRVASNNIKYSAYTYSVTGTRLPSTTMLTPSPTYIHLDSSSSKILKVISVNNSAPLAQSGR